MTQETEALVVDASVAVKWHLQDEEHSDEALQLLRRYISGRVALIAPAHIRYEVPSAIIVATIGRTPRLTRHQAQDAIEEFLALGLRTLDTNALMLSAVPLVYHHTIALYDALYLALAQELSLPFITADNKLFQRIATVPDVMWISDYPLARHE